MSRAVLTSIVAALLTVAGAVGAAEFNGRNVDRRTWNCHASTNDYGVFRNAEVRFEGERAYVTLPHGVRLVLILEDERIVDPHTVVAYDHKRGLRWELDVLDLH